MKRSFKDKIISGLLVLILCLAFSGVSMAGTGGTPANPQAAKFTKTLQYASGAGLTAPAVTFTFTFDKLSMDGDSSAAARESMPEIRDQTLSFSDSDSPINSSSMETVSKTSEDVVNGLPWTSAGVYKYQAVETASVSPALENGESITYSQAVYRLTVVVSRDIETKQLYVEQSIAEKITDDSGETADTGKGDPNPNGESYNFDFTNTFTKPGGVTPGKDALTIQKKTIGTGADPLRQFTFTITADDSATGRPAGSYSGKIYQSSSLTEPVREITMTADGAAAASFYLVSDEKIVFDNLPVGTTFTVEEQGTSGYLPSYTGLTAAGDISSSASSREGLSTGLQMIKADVNNNIIFTNTYDQQLIPTGILSNHLPFILLFVFIMAALVIYAAAGRRREQR